MISPCSALAIDRLCFDASAIGIYGRSGFIAWIAPQPLGRSLTAWSRNAALVAVLLALVTALAWLPLEAATSGDAWRSVIDGDRLRALLFDTGIGKTWIARVVLAVALVAVLQRQSADRLQFMGSALLLASLALGGHAGMDSGLLGALHELNDALHLLSGGAWLGGLLLLPVCLTELRDPALGIDARVALRRFSFAGHFAVALVLATGVINTMLILPPGPIDLATTYRVLFACKIGLVAAMTALALLNRYVFVPKMRVKPERTILQIQTGTILELAFGLAVITLVAVLGILDPM